MNVTAFELAQRFVGIQELPGDADSPFVMSMLRLDNSWPDHDEVAWCSAFVNYICWLLRLPRSKSLAARSWLMIGRLLHPPEIPAAGYDVVILKRGGGDQPGPEVLDAQGHVGFFAGQDDSHIELLGGNQSDSVSIARYPLDRVLGIRRLYDGR